MMMEMQLAETAAEFLKRETLQTHRIAESTGVLKGLLQPSLTCEQYACTLKKIFQVLSPIEVSLADSNYLNSFPSVESRPFQPALERDLTYFGESAVAAERSMAAFPSLPSLAAAAGVLYVLEGSANGGKMLCRLIETRLGITEGTGLAYFSLQAASAQLRFPSFKQELNERIPSSERSVAAEYAELTFRRFMQ